MNSMEPILLIDDDVELCAMLSDYLGRHGYEVTSVHNGKTGLGKALSGGYSMLLLDVMLPGLDGFEVLRRLRAAASPMNVMPAHRSWRRCRSHRWPGDRRR